MIESIRDIFSQLLGEVWEEPTVAAVSVVVSLFLSAVMFPAPLVAGLVLVIVGALAAFLIVVFLASLAASIFMLCMIVREWIEGVM